MDKRYFNPCRPSHAEAPVSHHGVGAGPVNPELVDRLNRYRAAVEQRLAQARGI